MALPGPRLSSSPSPPASLRPPPGPRQTDRHPACPWSYPPRTSHPTASQLLEILMVLYHPNLLVNAPISTTKGKCESSLDTGRLLIHPSYTHPPSKKGPCISFWGPHHSIAMPSVLLIPLATVPSPGMDTRPT